MKTIKKFSLYLPILAISCSITMLSFVFMPQDKIGGEKLFDKFIESFDEGELPHSITFDKDIFEEIEEALKNNKKSQHCTDDNEMITAEYSSFVPNVQRSLYSRTPPSRYYFKDKLYENDEMIVVTYAISSFMTPNSTADEYVLATYKKGVVTHPVARLISLRTVAKLGSSERLSCSIDTNLRITTTTTRSISEDKKDTTTEIFQIEEDGKIKVIVSLDTLDDTPKQEAPKSKKPLIRAF